MSPGTHLAVGVVCALAGVVDAVALTAVARPLVETRQGRSSPTRPARPGPSPAPTGPTADGPAALEIEVEEPTVTATARTPDDTAAPAPTVTAATAPTKVATVWFASEGIELTPTSLARLRALAKAHEGATLRVVGHADPSGRAEGHEYFSRMRARAVARALVELGVPPTALVTEARGAAEPLDVARTPAARARNRRVDIWQVP
ncbi:MAG: OmpA family protein [Myxococcota bacterium]